MPPSPSPSDPPSLRPSVPPSRWIKWFADIAIEDIPLVGGKNASLGEMFRELAPHGVKIPDGFAVTAEGYRYFLNETGLTARIRELLAGLDTDNLDNLRTRGHSVRQAILAAALPADLEQEIRAAYDHLSASAGPALDVAVRSSATAEDLPDASFAGQQETYLNVQGHLALLDTCRRCFASLFTDRAISYRVDKGFDHFKIALSIGVQRMVRADLASSGVMFTIDTETGFRDAVLINAAYGLGENVVQGSVNPDEFYVFKPTLKTGFRPILQKIVGTKEFKLIYDIGGGKMVKNVPVPPGDRAKFAITDDEILQLARWACIIEDHYSAKKGHASPMDIEWAKDGQTGELFIVQARPETVQSRKQLDTIETSDQTARPRARHRSQRRRTHRHRPRARHPERPVHQPVPPRRNPRNRQDRPRLGADHETGRRHHHQPRRPHLPRRHRQPRTRRPRHRRHRARHRTPPRRPARHRLLRRGRHRFCVRRQTPLHRTKDRPQEPRPAQDQSDDERRQPRGSLLALLHSQQRRRPRPHGIHHHHLHQGPSPRAPRLRQTHARLPRPCRRGEGRGEGPPHPQSPAAAALKTQLDALTIGYTDKPQFFVDKLAQGVAMIAAAFYPKDVILRLSDFKSNEYANLIGGRAYEPTEENPMIGFRGASRYYHPRYQAGFALECRAMKKVRDDMGLTNLKLMIPFCRTVAEGRRVQAEMEKHGLKRGERGLEIYVMCEIPSNVILADEFADIFDGFSIGSNDLTQLILGVDRDSAIVAPIFDERNAAVKKMIAQVIATCRARGRKIGICGQAPSDYPDFAQFLVEQGINSISLNPDTVLKTTLAILEKERALGKT